MANQRFDTPPRACGHCLVRNRDDGRDQNTHEVCEHHGPNALMLTAPNMQSCRTCAEGGGWGRPEIRFNSTDIYQPLALLSVTPSW
jgi:hypothetical protein